MGSGKYPVAMIEEDGYHLPTGDRTRNRVALDENGSPLLLYGVNPSSWPGDPGWVWLIANARAPAHYHKFRLQWDDELYLLGQVGLYDHFVTASWVGNERHHRWLEAMGFERFSQPLPFGPYGALFQPYRKEV